VCSRPSFQASCLVLGDAERGLSGWFVVDLSTDVPVKRIEDRRFTEYELARNEAQYLYNAEHYKFNLTKRLIQYTRSIGHMVSTFPD